MLARIYVGTLDFLVASMTELGREENEYDHDEDELLVEYNLGGHEEPWIHKLTQTSTHEVCQSGTRRFARLL